MPYTYEVSFEIGPELMEQLKIGTTLEKTLGYLRTLLPNMPGFVSARAMYSLETTGKTQVVVHSTWQEWSDLEAHRESGLAEQKVLEEFRPHVAVEEVTARVYSEVP
jgi:heme-degrading monooxygenase HmoA